MTSKKSTVFFSLFICIAGSILFYLKYSVMEIEDRIAVLKKELASEQTNQHILKAEWKELTTPERVQRLTKKYLKMQQIEPHQLKEYDPHIFHGSTKKGSKHLKRLSKIISEVLVDGDD